MNLWKSAWYCFDEELGANIWPSTNIIKVDHLVNTIVLYLAGCRMLVFILQVTMLQNSLKHFWNIAKDCSKRQICLCLWEEPQLDTSWLLDWKEARHLHASWGYKCKRNTSKLKSPLEILEVMSRVSSCPFFFFKWKDWRPEQEIRPISVLFIQVLGIWLFPESNVQKKKQADLSKEM